MQSKILMLLASRKFWSLVTALVGDAAAYFTHQVDAQTALIALVVAVSAYMGATAVEDHGVAMARGSIAAADLLAPPVLTVKSDQPPRG